jgi:hypothetical protein
LPEELSFEHHLRSYGRGHGDFMRLLHGNRQVHHRLLVGSRIAEDTKKPEDPAGKQWLSRREVLQRIENPAV